MLTLQTEGDEAVSPINHTHMQCINVGHLHSPAAFGSTAGRSVTLDGGMDGHQCLTGLSSSLSPG